MPPTISIVTVSYNAGSTISATISSVLSQTFKDFEYLIIDGGSSDDTMYRVSQFSDPRLICCSEADTGIYNAMNKGIKKCSGKYIAILNADDVFAKENVLEAVLSTFKTYSADIVYSGITYLDKNGNTTYTWTPEEFKCGGYATGFHTPHPGFFACSNLYRELGGFDETMKIAADFDLMRRFMEHPTSTVARLPLATVKMRDDGESSSVKSILRGFQDIRRSFAKDGVKFSVLRYAIARYLWKIPRKLMGIGIFAKFR